jgi:hypothetical protein
MGKGPDACFFDLEPIQGQPDPYKYFTTLRHRPHRAARH